MKNFQISILVLLFLSVFCAACQVTDPSKIDNDKELFAQAENFRNHKRLDDAISFYKEITQSYPESPYVIESQLAIANAYFDLKKYFEAETHYLSFQSLHPNHEKNRFVQKQIGLSRYHRSPRAVTKDQTQTRRALESFTRLTNKWPSSEEAQEIKPFLEKTQRKLDLYEYKIARFYFRQREYGATLKRLEKLKEEAESLEVRTKAWFLLGKTHKKMKHYELAQKAFETVAYQDKYPKLKHKAEKHIKKLERKSKKP
ncbi:MAG: outer membrane protein assembly factor BamD [Bdellovibrionales bacterium]|nr:outer membrane protein assembly factor BamD [Bdellovibrionales bacterium]